jgi:hypothetical protein
MAFSLKVVGKKKIQFELMNVKTSLQVCLLIQSFPFELQVFKLQFSLEDFVHRHKNYENKRLFKIHEKSRQIMAKGRPKSKFKHKI